MKRLLFIIMLPFLFVACASQEPPKEAENAPAAAAPAKPYGTLAQVMRAIPFPNSNKIFDTQTNDPEAKKAPDTKKGTGGANEQYGNLYGGWQGIESAAIALSETANLIMIPGRKCENGMDVPLTQENFKKWAQGLADAGQVALKAAQSKSQDAMVEASGVVSDACLACHEVYRDQPQGKQRCMP